MSRALIYLLALFGLLGMATIDAGVALGNKNATGVIQVRTDNLVNRLAQKGGGAQIERGDQIEGKGKADGSRGTGPITSHSATKRVKNPITSHPLKKPNLKAHEEGGCPYGKKADDGCWVCTVGKDGVSCYAPSNPKPVCDISPGCTTTCCGKL